MPPSKKKVIEQLAEVKNLGSAYATQAYDELGVRSLEDLVKAAKANELQSIKGVGAAKEAKILASAEELLGGAAPAPTPTPEKSEPKQPKTQTKKAGSKPKSADAKKSKPADAKKSKPAEPKQVKPADTKKSEPAAKKPDAPKAEAKKAEDKVEAKTRPSAERPRTTYRPPEPKPRPSIPGLIFKLTKKIIGRLLS